MGGIKYSQIPWFFAYFTPKNFRPPSAAGGAREKHKRGKTHRNTTDWYFYSFLWFTFENNMEITHFFGLFLKLNFSYSFLRVTISLLKIFRLRRYSFLRVTISLDQIVIISKADSPFFCTAFRLEFSVTHFPGQFWKFSTLLLIS